MGRGRHKDWGLIESRRGPDRREACVKDSAGFPLTTGDPGAPLRTVNPPGSPRSRLPFPPPWPNPFGRHLPPLARGLCRDAGARPV